MPAPRPNKTSAGGSMHGNAKGNIMSFFKPVSVSQSQPPLSPAPARNSATASSSPPIPSSPLGMPVTPPKPGPVEIGASDDDESDGGYSDNSLEDLSCILGRARGDVPAEQKPQNNPYATPRAKRSAVEFHSSPLAIMPRHKFDLKALAKDARRDDATTKSSLRVKEAANAAKASETNAASFATGDTIAEIVTDNGGHDARKVLRAVQRSDNSQAQPRYLFFDENYKSSSPPVAPKLGKGSPWNLLTQGNAQSREQHLISGLPQTILRKNGGLPDSLFEWIMDSLCVHTSLIVRQEYCNMVVSCPEQVERLLTAERLHQLFMRLGANEVTNSSPTPEFSVSRPDHEPYEGRDWSCLQSFISLLGLIASQLSVPAAEYAARKLVQLSLDKFLICNIDLLAEFEYSVQQLAAAIPSCNWDNFCFETCSMLMHGLQSRAIKATSLLCLPISTKRTHDLRRRIAVTTLFQDDSLAHHNPEDIINLRSIIDILSTNDFAITNKTNFAELRASIILLDMAIDDGSVVRFDDSDDEKKFNEEVDELAGKLREIWRKINDSGMKLARTEAKSVVEWVQQRLSHSVRTRKRAKKSVFDIPGQLDDLFLPRQREYMKKFLQKTAKSPGVEEASPIIDENTIVCTDY